MGQRKPEAGAEQVGGGVRKSGIPAGKLEMEERGNRRDMKQLMHQNKKRNHCLFLLLWYNLREK